MNYRNARFTVSADRMSNLPEDNGREVAFAGRSNAGKSSALNALCGQKALARVSKTPGRTQMLNFFEFDTDRRLVDLPGYGYAKVPAEIQRRWYQFIEQYLQHRKTLVGVVIVMDIRHPLKEYDVLMIEWCDHAGIDIHILLTKADKFKRGKCLQVQMQVEKQLSDTGIAASLQVFSSHNREGVEALNGRLDEWFKS